MLGGGAWPHHDFPARWKLRGFSEVFDDASVPGHGLRRREIQAEGRLPVVDQGAGTCVGRSNREDLAYRGPLPVIAFGDHTRRVKLLAERFVPAGDGLRLLTVRNGGDPRFFHHLLQLVQLPDRGYGRHFSALKATRFPVPPDAEQRRLAGCLDHSVRLITSAQDKVQRARELLASAESEFARGVLARVEGDRVDFAELFDVHTVRRRVQPQTSGQFPVIGQAKDQIVGFSDDASAAWAAPLPVIGFGDHTRAVRWLCDPFIPAGDALRVLVPRPSVAPRLAYWMLRSAKLEDLGYARHLRLLKRRRLWLPREPVQRRVVETLDDYSRIHAGAGQRLRAVLGRIEAMKDAVAGEALRGRLGVKA